MHRVCYLPILSRIIHINTGTSTGWTTSSLFFLSFSFMLKKKACTLLSANNGMFLPAHQYQTWVYITYVIKLAFTHKEKKQPKRVPQDFILSRHFADKKILKNCSVWRQKRNKRCYSLKIKPKHLSSQQQITKKERRKEKNPQQKKKKSIPKMSYLVWQIWISKIFKTYECGHERDQMLLAS